MSNAYKLVSKTVPEKGFCLCVVAVYVDNVLHGGAPCEYLLKCADTDEARNPLLCKIADQCEANALAHAPKDPEALQGVPSAILGARVDAASKDKIVVMYTAKEEGDNDTYLATVAALAAGEIV